jgi:hypothetical protein
MPDERTGEAKVRCSAGQELTSRGRGSGVFGTFGGTLSMRLMNEPAHEQAAVALKSAGRVCSVWRTVVAEPLDGMRRACRAGRPGYKRRPLEGQSGRRAGMRDA